MARARNIKPGFFDNERLADCGPMAMLLFAGLWTLADREGRLEDRPRRIKTRLLGYFDVNIERELTTLAKAGFIVRYAVAGERYIAIPTFTKHQTPHVKEAASVIPAPDEHQTSPVQSAENPHETGAPDKPGASTRQTPDEHPLIPDTGYLIADTPTPLPREARASGGYSPEFEAFWARYPRKEPSKKEAAKAWAKVEASPAVVMAGLERWLPAWASRGEPDKIPHATTWLNQERWTVPAPASARASPSRGPNAFEAAIERARAKDEAHDARRNGHRADDDQQSLLAITRRGRPEHRPDGGDVDAGAGGRAIDAAYRERPGRVGAD